MIAAIPYSLMASNVHGVAFEIACQSMNSITSKLNVVFKQFWRHRTVDHASRHENAVCLRHAHFAWWPLRAVNTTKEAANASMEYCRTSPVSVSDSRERR